MTDLDAPTLEPTVPPADPSRPTRIGPYRIDGLLGRGGMGEVYRGFDEGLQRPIAVKRVAVGQRDRAEARARFWREARALAALDHPGIVRVHRIDEADDGDLFLAMELVDGEPLSALLGQPWPSAAVAAIGQQAAAALAAAHRVDMTHRDVKPANLLLQTDGQIRVVDFGLARRADAVEERVTATGARVGTPAYMAPEQIDGRAIGPAADVFSLGVVMYRALAGTHPFARDSAEATALALASASCQPIEALAPFVDPALAAIVNRCLARDPSARFPDCGALAEALGAVPGLTPDQLATFADDQEAAEALWSSSARVAPSLSPEPRGVGLGWKLGLGAVVIIAAAWFGFTADRGPAPVDTAPAAHAGPAPVEALPPRPVVAVTGFEAPGDDPDDPRRAVLADVVRVTLAQDPEGLVAVPMLALAHSLDADETLDASIDPQRLTRPGRRLGHVDLVVRGQITDQADRLEVEVELVDTLSGQILREWTLSGPADAVAAGEVVGRAVAGVLGVKLPDRLHLPTRSVSAWGAVLAERRALRRGAFEEAERNLQWALQLDPNCASARLDELALLRARRQIDALGAQATRLLKRDDLSPRDRLLALAWQARAKNDGPAAIRALDGLLAQFPFDIAAYDLLMAMRSYDPQVRDMAALEQIARATLAIAPRHETAASRLIRVLRDDRRLDEAEALLEDIGVSREVASFAEIWAELDLYQGRLAQALDGFRRTLKRSPDDIYATHMTYATQILMGACDQAAADALSRIQQVEAKGRDSNLDWTYSLAVQALICREQWASVKTVMTRWTEHSQSGRDQVASLRPRIAIVEGVEASRIAEDLEGLLADDARADNVRHDLLRVLARVSTDVADLRARAQAAEAVALKPDTAAPIRRAWLRARQALTWRADLLEDQPEALARIRTANAAVKIANDEGARGRAVEALAFEAEALMAAGREDEGRARWQQVRDAGFARLYWTDLWILARRRLR